MAQSIQASMRAPLTSPVGRSRSLRTLASEYVLVVLAVLTWILLISAAALDYLTPTSQAVVSALYVGAYLTGGTLALRPRSGICSIARSTSTC